MDPLDARPHDDAQVGLAAAPVVHGSMAPTTDELELWTKNNAGYAQCVKDTCELIPGRGYGFKCQDGKTMCRRKGSSVKGDLVDQTHCCTRACGTCMEKWQD